VLIFQQGQTPDDFLFAHVLATQALMRGGSADKWIAEATLGRPPWRTISRLTVEVARLKPRAISRTDEPEAILRKISSRSARVSASRERRRAMGAMPPRGNNSLRTVGCGLP